MKDMEELSPFNLEAGHFMMVLKVGTTGWYDEGIKRKGSKTELRELWEVDCQEGMAKGDMLQEVEQHKI